MRYIIWNFRVKFQFKTPPSCLRCRSFHDVAARRRCRLRSFLRGGSEVTTPTWTLVPPPPSWHIINTQNHPKHWHLSLLVFNNHMTVSVGGCLRAMWVGLMPADRTKPGSKRTNSPPRNRPTDRPTSSMFPCQSRGRRVSVVTWSA